VLVCWIENTKQHVILLNKTSCETCTFVEGIGRSARDFWGVIFDFERISLYWIFWRQAGIRLDLRVEPGGRVVIGQFGGPPASTKITEVYLVFMTCLTIVSTDNFGFSHFGFGSGLGGSVNWFSGYFPIPS
jgi:hypothetical protein